MKTIIAGSRSIADPNIVSEAIAASGFTITEMVSGGARGVDRLGENWASAANIPIKRFIPDWDSHGKRAGFFRNTEMAEYADALIAIWDGKSRGTGHMISEAAKEGLQISVYFA